MTNEVEIVPQDIFFRLSGAGDSLWEIHRPQSVVIKLVEQGVFQGEILDIGCGIADNAIYIGNHVNNIHITAIDLVCLVFYFFRNKSIFFRYLKQLKLLVKKLKKRTLIFNLKLLILLKMFRQQI
jgi:SAM-dependent methyltransferase